MPNSSISQALTTGLLAGYGGQTKFSKITRGGFALTSSHFDDGQVLYHDEWVDGGGQELVKVGDIQYTRVYAGSASNDSPEIIQKLILFIQKLGHTTRLFSDCHDVVDDWHYDYQVIHQDNNFNITVGQETITHQNVVVFKHCFILSPVR